MAEIVNLRLTRKRKERMERARAADENRARFGRSRAETTAVEARRTLEEGRLDGHRRDDGDDG